MCGSTNSAQLIEHETFALSVYIHAGYDIGRDDAAGACAAAFAV